MKHVQTIPIAPRNPSHFSDVLGAEVWDSFSGVLRGGAARLGGRTVWNVNTTAAGGGVAEMLRSLVAYARGAGADVRWAVISPPPGTDEFFAVTKRIHNMLHGYPWRRRRPWPGGSGGLPRRPGAQRARAAGTGPAGRRGDPP